MITAKWEQAMKKLFSSFLSLSFSLIIISTLVYNIIYFTCKTSYFNFCIHSNVLTTKNLVSICYDTHLVVSFFKNKFIYFNWRLITLQYCIGFAIHQHESATGIHVFPILNPPPSSLPIPSLWVVSVRQPQASSIMH